jgi:hypothetical protein
VSDMWCVWMSGSVYVREGKGRETRICTYNTHTHTHTRTHKTYLHTDHRASLIDEIYGLIGQESVLDVPIGKLRGEDNGAVGDPVCVCVCIYIFE